jgi:ubiquinone/menaquinone biosynthesis C-methylase UbiE
MKAADWDQLANAYAEEVCDIFMRDRRGVIGRWLKASGQLRGRRTVLDLGCGIGSFFRKYGRRLGAKTGSDHSARMLHFARSRCRGQRDITWEQADVFALPARWQASADLVVCANVLTFVAPGACRRALRQIVRAAKPGGHVLLIIPSLESHDAVVAVETGRAFPARRATAVVQRDDRRQRFFTAAGIQELARGTGLTMVRVRKVWYPWADEGITRPPRAGEPPWDWLVTGRRLAGSSRSA